MLKCVVKKLLVRIAILLGFIVIVLAIKWWIAAGWEWLGNQGLLFWPSIFIVIVLSVNGIVNIIKECKDD